MVFGFVLGKPPRKEPDPNIPIFYDERTDDPIRLQKDDRVHFRDGLFFVERAGKSLRCYFKTERVTTWEPQEKNPHTVAALLGRRHGLAVHIEKKTNEREFCWRLA